MDFQSLEIGQRLIYPYNEWSQCALIYAEIVDHAKETGKRFMTESRMLSKENGKTLYEFTLIRQEDESKELSAENETLLLTIEEIKTLIGVLKGGGVSYLSEGWSMGGVPTSDADADECKLLGKIFKKLEAHDPNHFLVKDTFKFS